MEPNVFSDNLRRLRLEKSLTQEQLAEMLGVSAQSVSRWECGNTLPDVLLLPEIAKIYGVTVDDLYREEVSAYPSYAQRLLAVYEASGRTEDFLAAEQEFARIQPEAMTADDKRAWGVLYHYMMKHCASEAKRKLEEAMEAADAPQWVRNSAAQQRIALLCDLGQGAAEAARYDRELEQNPSDPQKWLLAAAAHHMAGKQERALEVAREGLSRFSDHGALYAYTGDICMAMKRYKEAFEAWEKALETDPDFFDAVYSMAFAYEELGQYDKAASVWETLAGRLRRKRMTLEAAFPEQQARECRKRTGK